MPCHVTEKPAFRCRSCGHLEHAAHAGERSVPCACSNCGAGVAFDRRSGLRVFEPQNWEVLADATPERLAELGIEEVGKHVHNGKGDVPPRQETMQATVADAPRG